MSALCPGSGRDGLQQDDRLLLDAAQESGCNNFDCGRVSGSGRVFDVPISLIEQSVVAANYARHGGSAVSAGVCLARDCKDARAVGRIIFETVSVLTEGRVPSLRSGFQKS